MKAVIPISGLGTHFLPMTKTMPREMLPVVDRPIIQYVVEELVASGITDILVVTGRGRRAIEDHFDRAFELEYTLREEGRKDLLESLDRLNKLADIHYVREKEQRGLGHAILYAQKFVQDEPFLVALGDTIYISDRAESVTKQCIDTFAKFNNPVIALQKIPRYLFKSHGMVKGRVVEERVWKIDDMVEKPKPEDSPSNLAITGTYILTPDIFDCIKETKARAGKKIQLTDSLKILAQKRMVFGYEFEGRRFEVGSKLDWFKADLCLKLERPEFREDMRDFINEIMKERSG